MCLVGAGRVLNINLRPHRRGVGLTECGYEFRGSGAHLKPTGPTVEADAHIGVVIHHAIVVDVMHHGYVDVVDRAVVEEMAGFPVAALVACACIAGAVVHATVEADVRAPITVEEAVAAVDHAPITGGPKRTLIGSLHPDTGHPVVAGGSIVPIAGGPEIVVTGSRRLLIIGQRRRRLGRCIHRRFAIAGVIVGRGGKIGIGCACIHCGWRGLRALIGTCGGGCGCRRGACRNGGQVSGRGIGGGICRGGLAVIGCGLI